MATLFRESLTIRKQEDVLFVRRRVRRHADQLGLGVTVLTKLVTAASELARNMVVYGGGGSVSIEQVDCPGRTGLRLTFRDRGPGISDISSAMTDGFTTGSGLGLGLPAARRLVDEFAIVSDPEQGTRITIIMWR